jgi:hypothetical protein
MTKYRKYSNDFKLNPKKHYRKLYNRKPRYKSLGCVKPAVYEQM